MAEPGSAEDFFNQGTEALQNGDNQTAIEHFHHSAMLNTSAPAPVYNLALAYAGAHQTEPAIEQLKYLINSVQMSDATRLRVLQLYFDLREGTADLSAATPLSELLADL